MGFALNESSVAPESVEGGVSRQGVLTDERVKGTPILLDRLTLAAGATLRFEPPANALVWLQMLKGEAALKVPHLNINSAVSDTHSVTLPSDFNATLSTDNGATLLRAEIPDLRRLDPGHADSPAYFTVADWRALEVFKAKGDARKRVFVVTQAMCGTRAFKVDMVMFPSRGVAPACHREGADTLFYIASGSGKACAGDQQFAVREGDVVFSPDREQHSLEASADGELRVLQIHAPAEFKTVWAGAGSATAWQPTGLDIEGRLPEREARERFAYTYLSGA